MSFKTICVSVNNSYQVGNNMTDLARPAHSHGQRTIASVQDVDILAAVKNKFPVVVWQVIGAFRSEETYTAAGGERSRDAFALGARLPNPVRGSCWPCWSQVE